MIKFKTTFYLMALLLGAGSATAVNINNNGIGEVLIFPYYTVNNNFDTFYSVVNTTAHTKALKVRILEGENSQEVLLFNVYLSPYDVWVGRLSFTTSGINGHVGEPSAFHSSPDQSCAPFLNKSEQEFLPYIIETSQAPYGFVNTSLQRSTDGHIEVIEMGTVVGDSAEAATHNSNGIPEDCEQLEQAWAFNDSYWSTNPQQDILAPSGGLSGTGTLLNVTDGIAVAYNAVALQNFANNGENSHTSPADLFPSLQSADSESQILHKGQIITANWPSGIEAVTAVLMQHNLFNQYDLTEALAAKTEWVINFPTKTFHVTRQQGAIAPFSEPWDGDQACESANAVVWDEAHLSNPSMSLDLCYAVNSIEFLQPGGSSNAVSSILASDNLSSIDIVDINNATKAGWMKLSFDAQNQNMTDNNEVDYQGLPALGFMVNKHTNAAAPVGVLAQYSDLFDHTSQKNIQSDLIFENQFE